MLFEVRSETIHDLAEQIGGFFGIVGGRVGGAGGRLSLVGEPVPLMSETPGLFASLRVRTYRLFASGQVVSLSGTWMQRVAQDWLVLTVLSAGRTRPGGSGRLPMRDRPAQK